MSDSTLNRFISSGTNAERLAFTPSPPTPASGPDPMYIWTETDTGDVYVWEPTNTTWIKINATSQINTMNFIIDGGGATITTGVKLDLGPFDFDIELEAATALADQSGSIEIDLWVEDFASYPPTVADSIVASAPIEIVTDTNSQDTTLSGWTTTIPAGNTIRVNVNSVTSIQRCGIALKYTR